MPDEWIDPQLIQIPDDARSLTRERNEYLREVAGARVRPRSTWPGEADREALQAAAVAFVLGAIAVIALLVLGPVP